jgi:hypothetical protein
MERTQMIGLIDSQGNYYEADKNITGATEVPRRPSGANTFNSGTINIMYQ